MDDINLCDCYRTAGRRILCFRLRTDRDISFRDPVLQNVFSEKDKSGVGSEYGGYRRTGIRLSDHLPVGG